MILKDIEIKFIKNKPFYIFEIDDFLPTDLYEGLKKNFPLLDLKNSNNLSNFKNNKFAFSSNSLVYQEKILNNNQYVKKLHELVYSKNFFYFFYSKLFSKIFFSRKKRLKHILKLLRYPKYVDNFSKKEFSYIFSFFSKIRPEIQYSYILNGGKIVPHTDSGEKLISLMIYFPDDNLDAKQKESEKNYGTQFWESNFSNFDNIHQEESLENVFKLKAKKLYKTTFLPKKLYGFIKNESSWHSVEPINVSPNYIRKSININFYF